MAKIICVFAYVITIISILSNAQNVPLNENNQYAFDVVLNETVNDSASIHIFDKHIANESHQQQQQQQQKTSSELRASNGDQLHSLHNNNHNNNKSNNNRQRQQSLDADDEMQQLLKSEKYKQTENVMPSLNVTKVDDDDSDALRNSDDFMNERSEGFQITKNNKIQAKNVEIANARKIANKHINNTVSDDGKNEQNDKLMPAAMLMELTTQTDDASGKDVVTSNISRTMDERRDDEYTNEKQILKIETKTTTTNINDGNEFSMLNGERSRYEEINLDFDSDTDNNNDRISNGATMVSEYNPKRHKEWPMTNREDITDDGSNTFEELSLNDETEEFLSSSNEMTTSTSTPTSNQWTQNIYKVTKPNKSKGKRPLKASAPQPMHAIRLTKESESSLPLDDEKPFIDREIFHIITELFDQFKWNMDIVRDKISVLCANDLEVYLRALVDGKTWAAKASDASGRYRGQLLFGNDIWPGSQIFCEEVRTEEMELSFTMTLMMLTSPEQLLKKHVLQIGQCLPSACTPEDIEVILSEDDATIKFNELYANATNERKGLLAVINVRRVPGEYELKYDPVAYLIIFISLGVCVIIIYATTYQQKLERSTKLENPIPNINAVHPIESPKKRTFSMEQTNISDDENDSMKLDRIHANNIRNGCTLELHPISINDNTIEQMKSLSQNPPSQSAITSSQQITTSALLEQNSLSLNNGGFYQMTPPTFIGKFNNGNSNGNDKNHNMKITNNNNNSNNNHNNHHSQNRNDDGKMCNVDEITVDDGHQSLGIRLLLCFDIKKNLKAILTTKQLPQESISCIHGMKVVSIIWIIGVHTYLQTFSVSENRYSKTLTERIFLYQIVANASYSVDTFFFISGLLVTLLFLREKKSQKINISNGSDAKKTFFLILYRYIRLTPVYFMVLIINTVALKYIYNGSVFQAGLVDHITCPNYWWRNILYIQTLFPFSQLCMIWSWYLADDMQFYVIAIVMLVISRRYAKASVAIIVTFLLTSWIVSAVVSLNFNYTIKLSEPLESFGYLYEKPWTRFGPYAMGMFAGCILNRFKSPPKLSPFINLTLWAMSICVMFLLLFGIWNGSLDVTWTAIYVSLGHTAWGLALIWITLSCVWGYAKPINNLLSYRTFYPFSRLTYCAYLIHPMTQVLISFQLKGTLHIQHGLVLTVFTGNAVTSFFCALILSLMFEAPIVRMMKVLFGK